MQTRIRPAYYLILIVYAVLIGWLLYREFGETRAIKYSLGEITVSARQSSGLPGNIFPTRNGSYRSLALRYRSFSLEIPEAGTAVLVYEGGTEAPVSISDIRRSSRDIAIRLGSGVELRISESEESENSYLLSADFSAVDDEGLVGIRFPWSGRDPELHGSLPILRASPAGTAGGMVMLPRGTGLTEQYISLPRTDETEEILLFRESGDESLVRTWFSTRGDLSSRIEARAGLEEFYNRAYRGWEGERWLEDAGSWEYAADSPPEGVTAAAMLLEALERGSYFSVRQRLAGGSPRLIDPVSALYLGSVVEPFRELGSRTAGFASGIEERIDAGEIGVFSNLDDLTLLMDVSPDASRLRDPLAELAEKIILAEQRSVENLAAAINAARFLRLYAGEDNPGVRYLIREELLPRICTTDFGYAVRFQNAAESRISAAAARLMIESGDEFSAALGYSLLVSVARSAGEYARVPARIEITEFGGSASAEIMEPEALPRLLPLDGESVYTPRGVSLGRGEGWIWTTASDIRYQAGGTSTLSFRFPTGGIHHFALYDIDPFDEIQMHGIPWKSDPEFQIYSDGWVYDSLRRTLFVKIRHRSELQSIRIIRRPAASSAEPPETAAPAEAVAATEEAG